MQPNITEEESLWVSLHDGILESLTSDWLARSMTLVVDVPYIWTFHHLPEGTRFHLDFEAVKKVQALQFSPWPGTLNTPQGLSREEHERLRKENYEKGSLQSTDWDTFASSFERIDFYYVMNASVRPTLDASVLFTLNLMSESSQEYPQIEVTAENVRFWLHPNQRELSLKEFAAMGGSYWEDFGKTTASPQSLD